MQFHSDEHRSVILLQCMKSPANDKHDEVREGADDYHFGRTPTLFYDLLVKEGRTSKQGMRMSSS